MIRKWVFGKTVCGEMFAFLIICLQNSQLMIGCFVNEKHKLLKISIGYECENMHINYFLFE